jgi:hypothetical protein
VSEEYGVQDHQAQNGQSSDLKLVHRGSECVLDFDPFRKENIKFRKRDFLYSQTTVWESSVLFGFVTGQPVSEAVLTWK